MNIEEAKSELEKKVIFWKGVIGIGVVDDNSNMVIEIAVDRSDDTIRERLNEIIANNNWQGHPVRVIPTDAFKFNNK